LAFRSPKWEKLHSQGAPLHETKELKVTLKNVKSVAIDCINSEHIRQLSVKSVMTFDLYFKSEQIDIFLCYLLLYMDTFFKLECHGSDSTRVFSAGEGEEEGGSESKLNECLHRYKLALAETYSGMILGLGFEEFHHMKSGKSRISSTKTDRELFEVLYEFLMCVVWITFHRQHWPLIHREVGRLLRTFAFNRSVLPEEPDNGHPLEEGEEEVDKTYTKSFAVGSLHNMYSPIMGALLPETNCKDSTSLSPSSLNASKKARDDLFSEPCHRADLDEFLEERVGVGIIGEPLAKYNKNTLLPVDDNDTEDSK
jgi:protein phosphatase 1 regulatory subunit 36